MGLIPWQAPNWHVSVCVHALPSLHTVPFATAVPAQTPAVHLSPDVQVLLSLQVVLFARLVYVQTPAALHVPGVVWHVGGVLHTTAPVHTPFWQMSGGVQALPSLHAVPSALLSQALSKAVSFAQLTAASNSFHPGVPVPVKTVVATADAKNPTRLAGVNCPSARATFCG